MSTRRSLPSSVFRPPSSGQRRRGFALLITITLLAFLVLLLVSLASLTRVETQVASNNQSIAQARQNALMALNLALGQLQRHTGPDQRVTATADLQPLATTAAPASYPTNDPASGVSLTGNASATSTTLASIDTYWRASRNRRWTGVWKNSNTTSFSSVADNPANYNSVAELQAWLISGNENTTAFTPSEQVTNFTLAGVLSPSAPTAQFGTTAKPYRLLVGPGSVHIDSDKPETLDRAVLAPEVEIKSTGVPGTNGASTTVGHYAWWVGDEGVKARANLSDPYAATGTPEANRTRLQSAQRPAIEAITALAPFDPTAHDDSADELREFQETLGKVVSPTQLTYLGTAPSFPEDLKSHYHDISVTSRGVFADVKNGGLKRDLSYLLSRPEVADFQSALKDAYQGTGYDPTTSTHNSPFVEEATAYLAKFPAIDPSDTYHGHTYAGNGTSANNGIFTHGATWEQLWSFYNMGNLTSDPTHPGVFTGTTTNTVVSRTDTATRLGIYPIIAKGQIFYRIRFDAAGLIWVDITPVITLANPYNVTLSGDFLLRFTNYSPQIRFGSPADPAIPLVSEFTQPSSPNDLGNCYLGEIQLRVRATGIPPGEAQIFTIDPAGNTTIASNTDNHVVDMINDYDEDACLTYNTNRTLPSDKTHVALYTPTSEPIATLHIDNITDYRNRVGYYLTHRPSTSGMVRDGFLVYPVSSGIQQGGGTWFTYEDGTWAEPHQATFYQVNYRARRIDSAGYGTPNNHPLHWMDSWVRYGNTGSHSATTMPPANPFLAANLMLPPGGSASAATTRWGLVNNGSGSYFNTPPASIGGPSSRVSLVNLMFDLPKPGNPLTSLGQLQHFNTTGHADGLSTFFLDRDFKTGTVVHQWQVNYPISNSYPHPRVKRDQVFDMRGDFSYNYDGSYLWNDILWDKFYFSSYPQTGDFDFDDPADKLVNARYRPFRDTATTSPDDETRFRGLYLAAQNLLADGAFNINSTSVEAWKAVFSSLKGVPIGTETTATNLTAPYARTLDRTGRSAGANAGNTENAWTGFRNLTPTEVNDLAEEMVLQVRKRGPFLSMSGFVNRRLATTGSDTFNLGLGGALQAAIDRVTNKKDDAPAPFNTVTANKGNNNNRTFLAELAYRMPNRISGFPGYLLQGDMLSSLGPTLAARSDTFTIRTYGDAVNPATGDVSGRAWCEATVQRTPDYVDTTAADATPASGSAAETFGRRYQIVSFRWLSPDDI